MLYFVITTESFGGRAPIARSYKVHQLLRTRDYFAIDCKINDTYSFHSQLFWCDSDIHTGQEQIRDIDTGKFIFRLCCDVSVMKETSHSE